MDSFEKTNLTFRIIEYCIAKRKFSQNDIQRDLKLDLHESEFMHNVLFSEMVSLIKSNTIICVVNARLDRSDNRFNIKPYDDPCMLLPNAIFSYVDHLEIVEARKAAKQSKRLAWIAIWISSGLGVISIIIGYLQLQVR